MVWDSLRYSFVGLFVGVGSAAAAVRVLNALVFGITAHDPLSFITSCLLLTSVAVAAAWLPARRAARLDPIVTLRSE
jgi:putative ABC transport system permease protein